MKKAITTVVILLALAIPTGASADNYGGVSSATYSKHKQMIYKTFGYGWEGRMMVRCMNRESGGNALAANWGDVSGGSFGLLQLNGVHRWRGESPAAFRARMWNPVTHLIAAKRLYNSSGFGPWGGSC